MTRFSFAKNIATATGNTPLVTNSSYVTSVVINSTVAGGTIKIVDLGSAGPPVIPAKTLIGPITLALPTAPTPNWKFEFINDAALMVGGVNAVTAGITAGAVDVWVSGVRTDDQA